MANQIVQLPADSTGKKVDTSELTVGGNTVNRQRLVVADDSTAAALGKVTNANSGSTDYGLVVRLAGIGNSANDGTDSALKVPVLPALANTAAPTLTDGRQNPLSLDTSARLRVTVQEALPAGTAHVGEVAAVGDVAAGASDSGKPVKIGAKAATANPTSVTDAQRVDLMADKAGRLVVVPGHVRELHTSTDVVTLTTTTSETTLLAAGAAGVSHDLTALEIANSSGTPARVDLRDATAGTVRRSFYIPAGVTYQYAWPLGLKQTTAANNWTVQSSASITSLFVSCTAVKNL